MSRQQTYQCQLLTFTASGRSSTIHRGSPSPHLAIGTDLRCKYWIRIQNAIKTMQNEDRNETKNESFC